MSQAKNQNRSKETSEWVYTYSHPQTFAIKDIMEREEGNFSLPVTNRQMHEIHILHIQLFNSLFTLIHL